MIQLTSKYRTVLKKSKVDKQVVSVWNVENTEMLQDCFACTDWTVFEDSCTNIDELTKSITEYIKFCENVTIKKKETIYFPNSKPWINEELREVLSLKLKAFKSRDKEALIKWEKKIKAVVRECKKQYKEKVELNIKTNPRNAWDGLEVMSGSKKKKAILNVDTDVKEYANKLNQFYARFDVHDFRNTTELKIKDILNGLVEGQDFVVQENDVRRELEKLNVRKACGPDGLSGRLLKSCYQELSGIFTILFNSNNFTRLPSTYLEND
ncbi:reverse transcriptase [Elysia marginata]|uniref:Reverse transcriptase n=1 Tax=Elysia marginata TaxID=1093978 RepID=A0AAV4G8V4_9GAST|nr:reverse transcriptase [Elysia marginata]